MNETYEHARETVEEHARENDSWARGVAVLVSFLAAALALTGIGEKSAQNDYLTSHIAVSDEWALYQAKNQRAAIRTSEIAVLESLPNAADAAVQTRIKEANDYVARMHDDPAGGDGMKQMAEKAKVREAERDAHFHRYHAFEYAAGSLELAIVLASVSVVTRVRWLAIGSGLFGAAAAAGSAAVALGWLG